MPQPMVSEHPEWFFKAVEQMANHVMVTDRNGVIVYVNPAFEHTTGYLSKDAVGQKPSILKSGLQTEEYYAVLWRTILNGESFKSLVINRKKNGELYYADQTVSPVKDVQGRVTHFVSVWEDVTRDVRQNMSIRHLADALHFEKYKLEQLSCFDEELVKFKNLHKLLDYAALKTAEILEAKRCSVMLADEDHRHLFIKASVGLDAQFVLNNPIRFGHGVAGRVAQSREPLFVIDIESDDRVRQKSRGSYSGGAFISLPIILGEELIGVINVADKHSPLAKVFSDLDFKILKSLVRQLAFAIENAKLHRSLEYLAEIDSVTQLHNRRYFSEALEREMHSAQRSAQPLCLLLIDIDHFKSFNRTFGEAEGNRVLRDVGRIIRSQVCKTDVVCRYVSDEFAVLMPCHSQEEVVKAAEKVVAAVEENLPVTVSVGAARNGGMMRVYDFVRKAHQALTEAQKGIDAKVVFFD